MQMSSDKIPPTKNAIQPTIIGSEELMLDSFISLYLDKSKPEFYSNATRCVMHIKGWDPLDYKRRRHAAKIGHDLVIKANVVARDLMEQSNATLGYMINFALKEMQTATKTNDKRLWWRDLMEIAGYKKMAEQINIFQTVNATQNNVVLSEEEKQQFNKKFLDFVHKGGLNE